MSQREHRTSIWERSQAYYKICPILGCACWCLARDKRYMNEETVIALGLSWITFSAHLSPWLSWDVPWSLGNMYTGALTGLQNKSHFIANTEFIFFIGWMKKPWNENGGLQGPLQGFFFRKSFKVLNWGLHAKDYFGEGQGRRKDWKGCPLGIVPPLAIQRKERTLTHCVLWLLTYRSLYKNK